MQGSVGYIQKVASVTRAKESANRRIVVAAKYLTVEEDGSDSH